MRTVRFRYPSCYASEITIPPLSQFHPEPIVTQHSTLFPFIRPEFHPNSRTPPQLHSNSTHFLLNPTLISIPGKLTLFSLEPKIWKYRSPEFGTSSSWLKQIAFESAAGCSIIRKKISHSYSIVFLGIFGGDQGSASDTRQVCFRF